jgi:hypothetical protein
MNYQIDRIQNIIAKKNIDFLKKALKNLKAKRNDCFFKRMFPNEDIMIKDMNELKSQNSKEYQNLINNFSAFFQNIFSSIIKVEENLIVKVKIHIKDPNGFEIEYPSWILFHNLKKDYKEKEFSKDIFSKLGRPEPFKIKSETANNLKKDDKEKEFSLGEIIFSVLGLPDAFKIKSETANNLKKDDKEKEFSLGETIFPELGLPDAFKTESKKIKANKWQTNLLNGYMNSSMIFTDDLREIFQNFED